MKIRFFESSTLANARRAIGFVNVAGFSTEYSVIGKDAGGKIRPWNESARFVVWEYNMETKAPAIRATIALWRNEKQTRIGERQ